MIKEITNIEEEFNSIFSLYEDVGWITYTEKPEELKKAIVNSSYIFGFYKEDKLIGIIRGLTDKVSLHYIQDIIVSPSAQNKGIGSKLVTFAKNELKNVRATVLLTDDEPSQLAFYKKLGLSNTRELVEVPLNCFVEFVGMELK